MSAAFTPSETVRALARLPEPERIEAVRRLSWPAARELLGRWGDWGHGGQLPPDGDGWRVWLLMAGRGFGKTRAGAEYVSIRAREDGRLRIALVGATIDDVRKVMIEGESGLLAVAREGERLEWTPHRGELVFASGAIAIAYSGANPERLRGPEHHLAWCDELAKWAYPERSWTNLMLGLRLGPAPRAVVTTTPRPLTLLTRLAEAPDTVRTRGRTADNLHLAPRFVEGVTSLYGGTRLGRQELDGELIEDVEGSLWPRELMERSRQERVPQREDLRRVVVGVDPPATSGGDACGIVVCGVDAQGIGYVLADATVAGLRPEGWAQAVVRAAETWDADRVVVETNQGGDMVESVLRSVDCRLPVRPARASKKKSVRAEPVAAFFERGKARFAGAFPALEDELAGMTIDGRYEGPGRSPDRADAMVWALTELLRERVLPRARLL